MYAENFMPGSVRTLKQGDNQIVNGVIWKQLLLFFFPLMLGTIFQVLYNTVDAIVVGQYVGKVALAAVGGPTGTIISLMVGLAMGITTGATVVVAQAYGAGDGEKTFRAVHTSMALGVAVGTVFGVLGASLAEWTLIKMGTPPEVLPYAERYLRIFMYGSAFGMVYNMGSSILRARGDSKRPFYLLVACTLMNIVFDVLFVAVMGWGVAGAGWATVICLGLSAAGVWVMLAREPEPFSLRFRRLGFSMPLLRNIISIGLPSGIQSSMYAIANIVIQAAINSFGVNTVAAWTILSKIDAFYWQIMGAFGMALATFSGQNFGARKYDRVIGSIRSCTVIAFIATFLISGVMIVFVRPLYAIFTDDAEVTALGIEIMKTMVPYYFTYVVIETIGGGIRGTGDTLVPTLMMATGICAFRLIWVWFVLPCHRTVTMLGWSYTLSWIITAIPFIIYYRYSHWMERSIARAGHVSLRSEKA